METKQYATKQPVTEEIKEEIKQYLQKNKNEKFKKVSAHTSHDHQQKVYKL